MSDHPTSGYRTLQEYDGYRFGADGSVWSCLRKVGIGTRKGGQRGGTRYVLGDSWRRLSLILRKDGYRMVHLRKTGGGIKRNIFVHHLILLSFGYARPSPRSVCRHYPDPNPSNNNIANLQWGSVPENNRDTSWHQRIRKAKKALGLG